MKRRTALAGSGSPATLVMAATMCAPRATSGSALAGVMPPMTTSGSAEASRQASMMPGYVTKLYFLTGEG